MQKSWRFLAAIGWALMIVTANAAAKDALLEFEGRNWRAAGDDVRVESYLGRDSLYISGARVWLDDHSFADGVIEFDIAYDEEMGFIGTGFRAKSKQDFEDI